jgi:hypothetical protein
MDLDSARRQELLSAIRKARLRTRDIPVDKTLLTEHAVRSRTAPLIVCYGAGVDSTAMLIELVRRSIRPDLILFADVGSEKPETYELVPRMNEYLRVNGFPEVRTVRLTGQKWSSLEDQCLATRQLPSLAFGGHSCSLKWKVQAQDRALREWEPALLAWAKGDRLIKAIGYDASPADQRRSCRTFLPTRSDRDHRAYRFWYPLQEWGLKRDDCHRVIAEAGLSPVLKSSCVFCPAMKRDEVVWLHQTHPRLFWQAIAIEDAFRSGPHFREGEAKRTEGLGRSWSWREFHEEGFERPADRRRRLRENDRLPLFRDLLTEGPESD